MWIEDTAHDATVISPRSHGSPLSSFLPFSPLLASFLRRSPFLPFSLPPHTLSAGFSSWEYYVTMPMPASTFTLAVGHWLQATPDLSIEGERRGQEEDRAGSGAGSGALAVQAGRYVVILRVCSPPLLAVHAELTLLQEMGRAVRKGCYWRLKVGYIEGLWT